MSQKKRHLLLMATTKHLENKYVQVTFPLIQKCEDAELRLYLFIKLHALTKNSAFPSIASQCESLKKPKSTLLALHKRMEQSGRLKVERRHNKANVYDITWYDLVNIRGAKMTLEGGTDSVPEMVQIPHLGGTDSAPPASTESAPEQIYTVNNRNITRQTPGEVNEVIALFKEINPSYDKFFKNTTQRAAVERMLAKVGRAEIEAKLKLIVQTNQEQYAPSITSPLQLEDKWASLINHLAKKQGNKPSLVEPGKYAHLGS